MFKYSYRIATKGKFMSSVCKRPVHEVCRQATVLCRPVVYTYTQTYVHRTAGQVNQETSLCVTVKYFQVKKTAEKNWHCRDKIL